MIIRIIAIGNKMPSWVLEGFQDYAKRFTSCSLELCEIPPEKRNKNTDIKKIIEIESDKLIEKVKPNHEVIALDVEGKSFSTEDLSSELKNWQTNGRHIDFLIGGPDGLSKNCLKQANKRWSLSQLTLPHMLVRIILVEQLYRAMSMLQNHPYHR